MSSKQMTLQNFTSYIDIVILDRGLDYFEDDRVLAIKQVRPNVYVARVEGSHNYTVEVALGSDEAILSSYCNCPYEGPLCKHQVAVYYALQEEERKTIPVEEDLRSRLYEVLAERSVHELIDIIMEKAEGDKCYVETLIYRFVDEDKELAVSREIIWSAIKQGPDIITVSHANQAMEGAYRVLEKAVSHVSAGKILRAIELYLEIISIATKALPLEYVHQWDDYDEGFYDDDYDENPLRDDEEEEPSILYDVVIRIDAAVQDSLISLDKAGQAALLEKILPAASEYLHGPRSKLAVDLLVTCCPLATEEHVRAQIMQTLDRFLQQLLSDEDPDEEAVFAIKKTQYRLIKEDGNQRAITDFLMENLDDTYFLHEAMLRADQLSDFNTVLALAEVGQGRDPRESYAPWKQFQFTAHEKLGNTEAARALAFELLTTKGFGEYPRLNGLYSEQEWPEVQGRVVAYYQQQSYVSDDYLMFLEAEELLDLMLELCRKDSRVLLQWYAHLLDSHQSEICQLLTKHVWDMVGQANSRGRYQEIRYVLHKFKESCGDDATHQIAVEILQANPRKRALRDELSRLLTN